MLKIKIVFATSNEHKFKESGEILGKYGIEIEQFKFQHNEIRSDSLEEIAIEAVEAAYEKVKTQVFVEDTGLFINSLNGFPGAYSAWVYKKIGSDGLLKLLENANDRGAVFKTCIAMKETSGVNTFFGECKGRISGSAIGKNGFGYDPIFIPDGETQTFAENVCLKNKYSHRFNSLLLLAKHLAAKR